MFSFLIIVGLSILWYFIVVFIGNWALCGITKKYPGFVANYWLEKLFFIKDLKEYDPCLKVPSIRLKVSSIFSFQKLVDNFRLVIKFVIDHILMLLQCCGKLILSLIKHLFSVHEDYFKNNGYCLNLWNSLSNSYLNLWNSLSNSCLNRWNSLSDILSQRSFYFNFFIGLGLSIFLLVVSLSGFHWVITKVDEELDVVMYLRQVIGEIFPSKGKMICDTDKCKEIPKFVFVDFDNETHKQWENKPAFIPRDYLKNLIHYAAVAGAKLIIVDVQLTTQSKDPTNKVLSKFLKDYKEKKIDCNIFPSPEDKEVGNGTQQGQECPPIILLRTFKEPIVSNDETTIEKFESGQTFLDDIVKPQESYLVQWASAQFISNDGRVRRWWLWQPIHYKELSMTTVIPSVELLTAAMVCNNNGMREGYEDLYQQLADPLFKPLKDTSYTPSEKARIRVCGKHNHALEASGGMYGIQQRIMYTMRWLVKEKADIFKYSGIGKRISVYTAKAIPKEIDSKEKESLETELSPAPFKDVIVLIGGSYDVGHDNHLTPLGEMPGGMIVLNAINSLLEYGEINELKPVTKFFLMVVFTILMSVTFVFFNFFRTKMLLGIGVLLLLLPVSMAFLGKGVWVDFALFLLVLEIFHLVNEVIEDLEKHGKHEHQKEPIKREV